ncbi:hypothetical protein EXIGLDRAFT_834601 [Exidia glandulosa HHB12029]|uniref:F-box domain-containing protein n=1 Tax=Exidia glandulosa HHB12029 TaxID=1314781 RepID=A0A165JLV7_EXIGL|nr:hypothetical protein EXIGLDRAFT_834601 [Exidia glandulosa HHB12029]
MALHTFWPVPYVPVLNNANAAPSKTETPELGHVNDLDARVVHTWRHILQKTFLSNDPAPNPTRFDVCRRIYDQLEHVDMRVELYISSRLGKVLRHIAVSPQAEDGTEARIADDLYKFRERAGALVLAIQHGIVGQTIPSESHASDAATVNPPAEAQNVVAGSVVWPSNLPLELHIAILRCSLLGVSGARSHATDVTKVWNLWRSDTDFLRTCALVSKAWATAAQWLLYSSRIILVTKTSLQRLLWTTTQSAYRPPLKHLAVHYYEPFDDFGVSLTSLIQQSTRLHTLELERGFPAFPVRGLSAFEHLSTLRLVDQAFLEIAPILCRLPNLETLILHSVRDMLPQHRPTTIPGLASSVSELEPVTFRLRRLEVSLVFISSAHLTWLLASSVKSLQHVSISPISHIGAGVVDGFPDVYDDLSTLLGPHVTSLHMGMPDWRPSWPTLGHYRLA